MRHNPYAMLLVLGAVLLATPFAGAASIPAWLDDAISEWNAEHEANPLRFVDIKDEYVWYMVGKTSELTSSAIRESIYKKVQENGYQLTDQEELVTTGKPPTPTAPHREKKCWVRSFVLNVEEPRNTKPVGGERSGQRQRMLTSNVCEDTSDWFVGFRILQ